jgi:N-formylmaleamate deformylase
MPKGYNLHANGIRLHLLHYPGPGAVLLLIPGITSPAITWGFVAERLSETYDVHVLDVRGRGLSETGDLDYTLDALAADALAVGELLTKDGEAPLIMGHSMGARIAIRATATKPGVFKGSVLIDPPVSGPNRRPYPSPWPWYGDSIKMAAKGCTAEDMRAYCPTWTEEQLALRAEWLHTCHWGAIRIAYDGFHTDDIHADLPKITVPTRLIIAGGAPVILPEDAAEIQTLLPAIEIRTVEGAGHMIPWDDLDGFMDSIKDFKV